MEVHACVVVGEDITVAVLPLVDGETDNAQKKRTPVVRVGQVERSRSREREREREREIDSTRGN